jgi:hypothetical protein
MDIKKLLGDIKGKALDLKHMANHTYELQEKTNKQQKDRIDLLEKEVNDLTQENESLKISNEEYQAQLRKFTESVEDELPVLAQEILKVYIAFDTTKLNKDRIVNILRSLPARDDLITNIQIESAIDELCDKGLLIQLNRRGNCKLTKKAKSLLQI